MPRYFHEFPKMFYNNVLLTDIITRFKLSTSYDTNPELFYLYNYQDNDTPEIIAEKYYNDIELHWVVLLSNLIFDPFFEFPLSTNNFSNYLLDKYSNIANTAPTILQIQNDGDNYQDGIYEFVPLISNDTGAGIYTNIRIVNHSVQTCTIEPGYSGTGYSSNTIFTIDNQYVGYFGSNFTATPRTFHNSLSYIQSTPHPDFGFQKKETISAFDTNDIISEKYYNIDKISYINLYQTEVFFETVIFDDGSKVNYQIEARYPFYTIYDYETDLNESKRTIKLLKKEQIPTIKQEFWNIIRS